jgi:hypothetical protein
MTAAVVFALKSDELADEPVAENPKPISPVVLAEAVTEPKGIPSEKPPRTAPTKEDVPDEKPEEAPFAIQKVRVTPTQQGKIIDLTLLGQAEGGKPIDFNTDKNAISVMTESGDTVERFFLPFPESAVMDADEKSIVNLKYWLKDDDAKFLWVKVFDHKLRAEIPE